MILYVTDKTIFSNKYYPRLVFFNHIEFFYISLYGIQQDTRFIDNLGKLQEI